MRELKALVDVQLRCCGLDDRESIITHGNTGGHKARVLSLKDAHIHKSGYIEATRGKQETACAASSIEAADHQ